MSEPTKLPWRVVTYRGEEDSRFVVVSALKDVIATIEPWGDEADRTDAEFIVRACNNHADLLVACEAARVVAEQLFDAIGFKREAQPLIQQLFEILDPAIIKGCEQAMPS